MAQLSEQEKKELMIEAQKINEELSRRARRRGMMMVTGIMLVAAGVGCIYWPLGLVAAGTGVLWDLTRKGGSQ